MNENKSLKDRIKNIKLTKTDSKIAEYLLRHQDTIGLETVTDLSIKIGVSDTSIIRFLRQAGYKGYSDFKHSMADNMVSEYYANKESLSPGEKYLRTSKALANNDTASVVMNKALENIKNTFLAANQDSLQAVTELILNSNRKYIIGFRGASACSNYMARKMSLLQPNVECIDRAESIALEKLVDVQKNDCVIMYTFPRYTELNYKIVDLVKERKAKIVIITDKLTSQLANRADYVFMTYVEGAGITVSYVAPLCLSETLLLLISNKMSVADKKRSVALDKAVSDNRLY